MQSVSTDVKHPFVAAHLASMKISAPVWVRTLKEPNTIPSKRVEISKRHPNAWKKRLKHFENTNSLLRTATRIAAVCYLLERTQSMYIFNFLLALITFN